jgi:DNA polymerase III delta prime subunit
MIKVNNPIKLVFLDECDGMTPEFQDGLRGTLNRFTRGNARFIMACNYPRSLSEPIISRCVRFEFESIPKGAVIKQMTGILEKEGVSYNTDDVFSLVDTYYPDVRSIVNMLQTCTIQKQFIYTEKEVKAEFYSKFVDMIIRGNYTGLVEFVNNQIINWVAVYRHVFDHVETMFPKARKPEIRVLTFDAMKDHQTVVDPMVNFLSFCIKLMRLTGVDDDNIR